MLLGDLFLNEFLNSAKKESIEVLKTGLFQKKPMTKKQKREQLMKTRKKIQQ